MNNSQNFQILENKLDALKISGRVVAVTENDFFTCYEIQFNDDITLNKIKARRDDLSIFFAGSSVDIETTGGAVFIKVEKNSRGVISFNSYAHDIAGGMSDYEIPLVIGQKEDGTRLFYDLTKTPHILTAGATGSGKSVFMHNLILSCIYSRKTALILIDVKRVEFSLYEGIPHLAAPICYNARQALETLRAACDVMEKRYITLKEANARNIKEYRDRGGDMQYITIFIDELADLMLTNSSIEKYIVKLAQLGRAAGIHLVVATQRPDASILSGLIRANIPSRVSFAVQKATDSRIILDMSGAENLRGAGDGLFLPIGSKTPAHFQAPFIDTAELETLAEKARHCND